MAFTQSLSDFRCKVSAHWDCGGGLKVIRLQTEGDTAFTCLPGQFVMFDLPDERFFFRRPFSVLDVDPTAGTFDIYYKIVGRGTAMMAQISPGAVVNVLGPLGTHFQMPQDPAKTLLIGGGIGIAPLYFMGRRHRELEPAAKPSYCFYGVRGNTEIGLLKELTGVFGQDRLLISTDDGSFGLRGNVCDLLKARPELVQEAKDALVCGPTPMMAATARLLNELNPAIRVQVSLEEHMPCGTGACTGCVVGRTDRLLPAKVCTEGPVFPATVIRWEGIQASAGPVSCDSQEVACST